MLLEKIKTPVDGFSSLRILNVLLSESLGGFIPFNIKMNSLDYEKLPGFYFKLRDIFTIDGVKRNEKKKDEFWEKRLSFRAFARLRCVFRSTNLSSFLRATVFTFFVFYFVVFRLFRALSRRETK